MTPTLEELWTEDCRKICPDFELFDEARMHAEIDRVKQKLVRREVVDAKATDIEIIVWVIRNLADDLGKVPASWWWLEASLNIMPNLDPHPWYQLEWWIYNEMRGKGEITTVWGSASSSKSSGFAAMVITSLIVWHGCSHAYISCPYKNSAEDKIFREITKRTNIWAEKRPAWAYSLGITIQSPKNSVTFTDRDGLTSSAVLVSLETTAQVQGFKVERILGEHKHNSRAGVMMFIGDELIINPAACEEYWNGRGNLVSNPNFMGWVGMNPIPHQVKHPNAIRLSAPVDRKQETMNEMTDFTWRTAGGRLIRLCLANSPNRHVEKPVFPYLINLEQARRAEKGGDITRMAQVAAWGWSGGLGNGGVLSLDHVNNPSVQSEPVWKDGNHSKWAFFDLAFGGSDPAGYAAFRSGTALINGQDVQVINCDVQELIGGIPKRWTPTAEEIKEFVRLAEARGGKAPILEPGREVEANGFMVLAMLRTAAALGIPKGRVSFDSSLRPDVTKMAVAALGHVPWYYDGTRELRDDENLWPLYPPVNKTDGSPAKWSDFHRRPISAAWRFAEHLIAAGHVHNIVKMHQGCQELLIRPWVVKGEKSDVMAKKELASSPIYGETLALGLAFGVRFAGALPQLARMKPVTVGGDAANSELEKELFTLRGFRPSSRLWKR